MSTSELIFEVLMFTLILMVALLVILLIIFEVYERVEKHRDKIRSKIKKCIYKSMLAYCSEYDIPVSRDGNFKRANNKEAAGYIIYICNSNTGIISEAEIFIQSDIDKLRDVSWATLAHEVGHFISQNRYNDQTEGGADMEAYNLIVEILPEKDKKLMYSTLDIFFDDRAEHNKEGIIKESFEFVSIKHTFVVEKVRNYYERIRNKNR